MSGNLYKYWFLCMYYIVLNSCNNYFHYKENTLTGTLNNCSHYSNYTLDSHYDIVSTIRLKDNSHNYIDIFCWHQGMLHLNCILYKQRHLSTQNTIHHKLRIYRYQDKIQLYMRCINLLSSLYSWYWVNYKINSLTHRC